MINHVILLGRLTATPELKTTTSGTTVTTFTIAVDRRFQTKDGEKQTDFINCVAWRNTAEFISKYFKKGDPISIQGELQPRKYTDKDGNNRIATEVVINDARFVPSNTNKSNTNNSNTNNNPTNTSDEFDEIDDDDLPF